MIESDSEWFLVNRKGSPSSGDPCRCPGRMKSIRAEAPYPLRGRQIFMSFFQFPLALFLFFFNMDWLRCCRFWCACIFVGKLGFPWGYPRYWFVLCDGRIESFLDNFIFGFFWNCSVLMVKGNFNFYLLEGNRVNCRLMAMEMDGDVDLPVYFVTLLIVWLVHNYRFVTFVASLAWCVLI